jgi:hypothetical protein
VTHTPSQYIRSRLHSAKENVSRETFVFQAKSVAIKSTNNKEQSSGNNAGYQEGNQSRGLQQKAKNSSEPSYSLQLVFANNCRIVFSIIHCALFHVKQ